MSVTNYIGGETRAGDRPLAHLSDEALLALVSRGDEPALAELYDRYGRVTPAGLVRGSVLPLTRRVPAGAAVLISLEPAGGSAHPTGPVVLKAETA